MKNFKKKKKLISILIDFFNNFKKKPPIISRLARLKQKRKLKPEVRPICPTHSPPPLHENSSIAERFPDYDPDCSFCNYSFTQRPYRKTLSENRIIRDEETNFIVRAFTLMFGIGLSKSIGLGRDSIVLTKAGSSAGMDAYAAGMSIGNALKTNFIDGHVIPVMFGVLDGATTNRPSIFSLRILRAVFSFISMMSFGFASIYFWSSPSILTLTFSGLVVSPDYMTDAALSASLGSIYLLGLGFLFYFTFILQYYNEMVKTTLTPILSSLTILICLFVLPLKSYYTLAIGHSIGMCLQIIFLYPSVTLLRPSSISLSDLHYNAKERYVSRMCSPILILLIISTVTTFITKSIAGFLFAGGCLAGYYVAERTAQFFSGIVGQAFALMCLSQLSQDHKGGTTMPITDLWFESMAVTVFLLLPIAFFLFFNAIPFLSVLYFHGSTSWTDIKLQSIMLASTSITLVFYAISKITITVITSQGATNSLFGILLSTFAVNISLALLSVQGDAFGLAFAIMVSNVFQGIISLFMFERTFPGQTDWFQLLGLFIISLIVSLPLAIITRIILVKLGTWSAGPWFWNVVLLLVVLTSYYLLYFFFCLRLKSGVALMLKRVLINVINEKKAKREAKKRGEEFYD